MSVKEEIKKQIEDALSEATFPIETPEKLLEAFPKGAATTCKAGEVELTAGEAGKLLKAEDFPFQAAKQVAETIVARADLTC